MARTRERGAHPSASGERSHGAVAEPPVELPALPGTDDGVAIAVVHAADGVRHLVAARSSAELLESLADYVRRRASRQLWPRAARRGLDLLERGRADSAIRLYLALAGRRWDEERLTLRSVELR